MIETIMVSVSGPAFSLLLFENVNSYNQEGFLLGEIVEKEKQTITDNDQGVVNVERNIKVNCAVPCPRAFHFYNSAGVVDEQKLRSFLGDKYKNVIAWYKHKYSSTFKFTLREKIIHKQLSGLFSVPSDLFTFCLLRTEENEHATTHLFSQTFIRYANCSYQPLPMHIVNLSDAHNSYKRSEPTSELFSNIIKKLKIDFKKTQGLVVISMIQKALNTSIDQLVSKRLLEAEERLFKLEKEVEEKRKLRSGATSISVSVPIEKSMSDVNAKVSTSQKDIQNRLVENGSPEIIEDNSPATHSDNNYVTRKQSKNSKQSTQTRSRTGTSKSSSKMNPSQWANEEDTVKTRTSTRIQTKSYSQVTQTGKN